MPRSMTCCLALTLLTGVSALAQDGGSTIIPKREVNEVLLQGLDRLATGRAVSDIVVRHLNVGEENIGVSVVQRTKVEVRDTISGGAHTHVDEIYYIVSGTGTMVTGGEFVNKQSSVGGLLGPNDRGEDSWRCPAVCRTRGYCHHPQRHAPRLAQDRHRYHQLHHLPGRSQ